jgi:hypothetical protein
LCLFANLKGSPVASILVDSLDDKPGIIEWKSSAISRFRPTERPIYHPQHHSESTRPAYDEPEPTRLGARPSHSERISLLGDHSTSVAEPRSTDLSVVLSLSFPWRFQPVPATPLLCCPLSPPSFSGPTKVKAWGLRGIPPPFQPVCRSGV